MSLPKERGLRSLQQFAVLCFAVWTLAVLAAQSVGIWSDRLQGCTFETSTRRLSGMRIPP